MFNITEMAEELMVYYPPAEQIPLVYESYYVKSVVYAIKKLYVDINHPTQYDHTLFTTDTVDEKEILYYDHDFDIVQEEYIFILAKLRFKRIAISEVTGDGAVSYTTDALSVTGAKEAYKSLQQEIEDLENERRIVFHKMMTNEES